MFSRRDMLAVSAAGAVMTAAPRAPRPSVIRTSRRKALSRQSPGTLRDPWTKKRGNRQRVSVGAISARHRRWRHADGLGFLQQRAKRVQNGGWARGDAERFRHLRHDHGRQHEG